MMRDLTIGALVALAIAFFASAFPVHAQTAPACHTKQTLMQDVFHADMATAYDYEGDYATALQAAITKVAGNTFDKPASAVMVVNDRSYNIVAFYLYGADGCFMEWLSGPPSNVEPIFDAAMIPLPFQPDIPGAIKARYTPASDNPDRQFNDRATSQWFTGLHVANPEGGVDVGCCDQSDCRATKADFEDGHWVADSVQFPGEKVIVPDGNVLKNEVSPIGAAVLCEAVGGLHEFRQLTVPSGKVDYVYCFVPPPQFG